MTMINKKILEGFERQEIELEKDILEILKNDSNDVFRQLYDEWKSLNTEVLEQQMYDSLKENYSKYWINAKYNKSLNEEFNMIYFEYGGLGSGTEIEAYGIDFDYKDDELPTFQVLDKREKQLSNIETFPTCDLYPLSSIWYHFEENGSFWDDNWDELLAFYELSEITSYKYIHRVISKFYNENGFAILNFKKPFYFTINEHDNGQPPTLIYVIEK